MCASPAGMSKAAQVGAWANPAMSQGQCVTALHVCALQFEGEYQKITWSAVTAV